MAQGNYWFKWNGEKSTDYGVYITEQPAIIRASERATFTAVPGRSGTLTQLEDDYVYDDVIYPIECYVKDTADLQAIARYLQGAGTLELASRPGGYYKGRIINQLELVQVMRGRNPRSFTLNFRLQPFWYADANSSYTYTSSLSTITNPGGVPSEPVITVTGSGEITLMVGQTIIELSEITDSITLSTPLMEAYNGVESMNRHMSGDFPYLMPGQTAISWTGNVTSVHVQPNWRYPI